MATGCRGGARETWTWPAATTTKSTSKGNYAPGVGVRAARGWAGPSKEKQQKYVNRKTTRKLREVGENASG